jgi:hypothetical protein
MALGEKRVFRMGEAERILHGCIRAPVPSVTEGRSPAMPARPVLIHRWRPTRCPAGGPATSGARSPWFNNCPHIASNFWQWRRAALL